MTRPEAFCPYVGLQPYTEADREYFFGRERDTRIITSNLYAASLTVLYGASGVGKSSVLMAGVVPRLQSAKRVTVVVCRAWQDVSFLSALKSEIIKAVEATQQKSLNLDPTLPFDDLLFEATQAAGGSIFVLLDQFEEYFLYHPESQTDKSFDSAQDRLFDAEFARAVNREDVDASFLIAIREDSLSRLDRFRARIPNLLGNTLRLEHLDASAAEDAIRKPLEKYNLQYKVEVNIEDELVHEVIQQVRTGQVSLAQAGGTGQTQTATERAQIETPFLQLVMTKLWGEEMKESSSVLRLSTLQRLGGAERIVRTHLDGVMDTLSAAEQSVSAIFFDRLVTPTGTKIAQATDDLIKYGDKSEAEVTLILKTLSDARVLRPIAPPPDHPTTVRYEIFHDVLAPAVLDWRRRYVEKQEQERARREERERRAQLRLRFSIIIGAILLLLFGALSFVAFQQKSDADAGRIIASTAAAQANDQRDVASTAQANAITERNVAATAQANAVIQRDAAATAQAVAVQARATSEALRQLAFARELALASNANIDIEPERSLLLSR